MGSTKQHIRARGLWCREYRPLGFALVFNYFGIKYKKKQFYIILQLLYYLYIISTFVGVFLLCNYTQVVL